MENHFEEVLRTVKAEEEELRPVRFTSREAWELGCLLAEKIRGEGLPVAAVICALNGKVLFQYAGEGATLNNQNWLRRKCNTAALMERSTLRVWAEMTPAGRSLEELGVPVHDYAMIGGGFPIRLKSGEIAAVAAVSGLAPEEDHKLLTGCLRAFLEQVGNL